MNIKKKLCILVSRIILRFYSKFRECSGLKASADNQINNYKRNEKDVKIIKENLPKLQTFTNNIKEENIRLVDLNTKMLIDLKYISYLMDSNKLEEVKDILYKYNRNNKEIKCQ